MYDNTNTISNENPKENINQNITKSDINIIKQINRRSKVIKEKILNKK